MKLKDFDTDAPKGTDEKNIENQTKDIAKKIAEMQKRLLAESNQSLLVVLQGMDSSGKDGVTREAFKYCSPSGVSAYSFKKPTEEEFAHDFIWRAHKQTPRKGQIKVFNRSYYEDVLIQKVHKWIDDKKAKKRYDSINAFEYLLQYDANTTILKLYLHLSPERQLEKLKERMEEKDKFWKHNDNDWKERGHWNQYIDAYEDAFKECDQPEWKIVPADQRWYRNHIASKFILETLEKMDPQYPGLETEM